MSKMAKWYQCHKIKVKNLENYFVPQKTEENGNKKLHVIRLKKKR